MNQPGKFLRNKTVLVTGGGGLIGSAFVQKLLEAGAKVRAVRHIHPVPCEDSLEIIDGDLRDADNCRHACEGMDAVIHAAGVSGGSKQVTVAPIPMFTDSLLMNTQILEAARLAGVERFLFLSNSSVYPRSDEPLCEDIALQGAPENETGMVKLAGEAQCALYAEFSDMRIGIIRAGNAYGPNDNFDLDSSHVAPALIRKAVEGQSPFRLWGNGSAQRDFIHTADIAEGGLYILEHLASAEPVNVATGRTVTIRELAEIILTETGREGTEIEFESGAPPASPAKVIDVSRMREIGFEPKTTLEAGLRQTIEWFRGNRGGGL